MAILMTKPKFATTTNTEGKTALHLLARNPSAFASESRPCEFFFLGVILTKILRSCIYSLIIWYNIQRHMHWVIS